MKSAVENLNPTRVKVTAEVPFEDIKPSLDAAYRSIAAQVNIPGFRKGKIPSSLIDQRFGRQVVLDEALNAALPQFLQSILAENDIKAIGRPDLDVGEFTDGEALTFTVEWSVQPDLDLPDHRGLAVNVEDSEVTEADVDEEIDGLRKRFGSLNPVDRAVAAGDFVTLDLLAEVDGESLPEASGSGQSYEVGSDSIGVPGLDEALVGLSAGESVTVAAPVQFGDHAGSEAQVTATVTAVNERVLPDLDDDFAQLASEFDTVAELREALSEQLGRYRLLEQGMQARDRALEALLALVEVPIPEEFVAEQVAEHLEGEGKEADDPHGEEIADELRQSLRRQFVLDAVAAKEELSASEGELTQYLVQQAARYGVPPEVFAREVMTAGQAPGMLADVVRGKALALVLETAVITDASGNTVDLSKLNAPVEPVPGAEAEAVELKDDDADAAAEPEAEQ